MNKKLMAVAVAGVLAAPGLVLAQATNVTVSGFFGMNVDSISFSNSPATRLNTSQIRLSDNSSKIVFKATEDLGNGLSAIAQLDIRFDPTQSSVQPTSNPIGTGSTFAGLQSATLGTFKIGREDLHYGGSFDLCYLTGCTLQSQSIALFDFIGQTPIANATRTSNMLQWISPRWSGFGVTAAWSANAGVAGSEYDMINVAGGVLTAQTIAGGQIPGQVAIGTAGAAAPQTKALGGGRKGGAWNFSPSYVNGPLSLTYSYWNSKPDAPTVATNDQRGDWISGYYTFGGLRTGIAWNKSKLINSLNGVRQQQRTSWYVPVSYNWGASTAYFYYTKAGNISSDNVLVAQGDGTGAKLITLAYTYALSKRTQVGLTYAKLTNDRLAAYNFFASSSLGSSDTVPVAGEGLSSVSATIRHVF